MVGGFVVTDRMLQMFVRKRPAKAARRGRTARRGCRVKPTWVQLVYLRCAVCFILALKGLSGPRTARTGNLIGAVAAVVAVRGPVLLPRPRPRAADAGSRSRSARPAVCYGARRVQMTQMPQMVALFNGVGGGAAALVALLELHDLVERADDPAWFMLAATAFTIVVGSVSFAGSLVTFAKLQELMTSRPVVFPGLPVLFAAARSAAVVLSVVVVRDPTCGSASCWRCSACCSACCWCCRSAGPTSRS